MDYKARDPEGRGFIIHNARAYHVTSDIYILHLIGPSEWLPRRRGM